MPSCKSCGNNRFFMSSQVPSVATTANGPISGLVGKFDTDGDLVEMESMGAEGATRRNAAINPDVYFDTCMKCGSNQVDW